MLIHIVIFTWKTGTTEQQVEGLRHGLNKLATEVGEVLTLQHGSDVQLRAVNGDYALVASFKDQAAWQHYQNHEAHKTLVRNLVAPLRAHSVSAQIELQEAA